MSMIKYTFVRDKWLCKYCNGCCELKFTLLFIKSLNFFTVISFRSSGLQKLNFGRLPSNVL